MFLSSCFSIFLCVMTCLSLTPSKTLLNVPKKCFKGNFSWSIAAETWDASCFKKGLLEEPQTVPNTCAILSWQQIFYQNLTVSRWIFQIPLKYIKLVIPRILFMLVLCSFNLHPLGKDCFPFPWTFIASLGMGKNPTQKPKLTHFYHQKNPP